jgi:sugar lactone lactonase YvrE
MRIITALVIGLVAAVVLAQAAGNAAMMAPIAVEGFQTPESVLYDSRGDVYLVSNINGNPTAADGNGFISKVSPGGKVVALKWIDGAKPGVKLNAPKGMAIVGDTLYVSDITAVRKFNRATGQFMGSIDVMGSTFMNDLAAGRDGSVYASDSGLKPDFSPSGTDAVYRIDRMGAVSGLAKGADLNHPNGIAVRADGSVLVVVFAEKGEVYALGKGGKKSAVATLPAGQLDGIEIARDGSLLISSWASSSVYRVMKDGMAKAVVENVKAPADIGYDGKRNRVLIPQFQDNKVLIQSL